MFKNGLGSVGPIAHPTCGCWNYECDFHRVKSGFHSLNTIFDSLVRFGELLDFKNQMARLCTNTLRTKQMVSSNLICVFFSTTVCSIFCIWCNYCADNNTCWLPAIWMFLAWSSQVQIATTSWLLRVVGRTQNISLKYIFIKPVHTSKTCKSTLLPFLYEVRNFFTYFRETLLYYSSVVWLVFAKIFVTRVPK